LSHASIFPSFQERGESDRVISEGYNVVKFQHLEDLFNLELGEPVKIAHKLSDKVLHSANIERMIANQIQLSEDLGGTEI